MEISIGDDGLECALPAVGDTMLGAREPAEEIGGLVIQRIGDEMMTDARFAGCRVYGTFSIESERHEDVAVFAAEMPHNGVLGAADAVGRAPSFSSDGRERGLHLVHDASLVGNRHVVYAVELARPTTIERFVGGASSDDRAVR